LRKRYLIKTTLIVLIIFIVIFAYTAYGIYHYGSKDGIFKADAAIVLGAATWGDQPSPVFRERINHAILLYKEGYVRKIIFTGGRGDSNDYPEAIVARQYALEHAVPEADILIENQSKITEQNLCYANQIAVEHRLERTLIVSDPLHMKRAMLIAQDLGMDAYSSPTPTTRYKSLRSQLKFLARESYFYLGYLICRPFVLQ